MGLFKAKHPEGSIANLGGYSGMGMSLFPDRIEYRAAGKKKSIPIGRVDSIEITGTLNKKVVVHSSSEDIAMPGKPDQCQAFVEAFYALANR